MYAIRSYYEIRESAIENKRVLAVKAMYRRKVKGNIMGSSKTGSIVYIQPEATFAFARELNNLEFVITSYSIHYTKLYDWGTSRYSIPFFMHPISEMKLNVLESCVDEDHPKLYDDITAGEFLHERLVDLGLIKK